jgi:hypothetical protein
MSECDEQPVIILPDYDEESASKYSNYNADLNPIMQVKDLLKDFSINNPRVKPDLLMLGRYERDKIKEFYDHQETRIPKHQCCSLEAFNAGEVLGLAIVETFFDADFYIV